MSYLDDVEGGNDVSIDGCGRRNASGGRIEDRGESYSSKARIELPNLEVDLCLRTPKGRAVARPFG